MCSHCFLYNLPVLVGTNIDQTAAEAATDSTTETRKTFRSSWGAKARGGVKDSKADFLSELGQAQEYNINVDHGAFQRRAQTAPTKRLSGSKCLLVQPC